MKSKQKTRVLDYMRRYGAITQLDALRDLSCMRLASRISELRKDGFEIQRTMVTTKNRDGEPVSFAQYRLLKEELT